MDLVLGSGSFFPEIKFALSADFKIYLLYAFICLIVAIITALNLLKNPKFYFEGYKSNFAFISLFAFLLSFVGIIYFIFKAWFSIPSDGYMDYFAFATIAFVIALIFGVKLASNHISGYGSHADNKLYSIPIAFFLMESIYSFGKGVSAIPHEIIMGIVGTIAIAFIIIMYVIGSQE